MPVAYAGTISFTGDLRINATVLDCGLGCMLGAGNTDVDYAQYAAVVETFNVPVTSAVSALTFSYGAGTNGAGTAIAAGGFEPYLSLFDHSGNFLASTFFGTTCPAGAQTNAGSGFCYDVALDAGTLAPANYQIAISAFENMSFAENSSAYLLSDGFTGLGNLAPGEDLHYAFDVVLTPVVATPEPGTAGLLLLAAGAMFLKRLMENRE
jgi:hypothetical protein